MELIRGLGRATQQSQYSIKDVHFGYNTVSYAVPPDKALHKKFSPRLVLELESWRMHGAKVDQHSAKLVIDFDEIEKLVKAVTGGLLESFQTLVENKMFETSAKAKSKEKSRAATVG